MFGELDEARLRVSSLEAVLAAAEAEHSAQVRDLETELAQAQAMHAALQNRILALDAAVTRCEQERAALEQELAAALGLIAEFEAAGPVEIIREVMVVKIEPDPQVVAELTMAK